MGEGKQPVTATTYCTEKTRSGEPCRAFAIAGSQYCFTHDPARAGQRAAAHSAGGKARHGRIIGPMKASSAGPGAAPVTLASVGDVVKLLECEVNSMLTLEPSLSRGQTIARLAMVFIKAFEVSEIEQRLDALEKRIVGQQ